MDTVHDLPARQETHGSVAQLAQTVAMLADALARRPPTQESRRMDIRTSLRVADALSRAGVAQAAASTEESAALRSAAIIDNPGTPSVDEHALAAVSGAEQQSQADTSTATAERAFTEARSAMLITTQAVARTDGSPSSVEPVATASYRHTAAAVRRSR